MQSHTLKVNNKRGRKKRVGRGGKRGTYSGRGIKGQKARSGRRIRPEMRDLIKKMPMRRGHKHTGPRSMRVSIKAVIVAKHFKKGERINPRTLLSRGVVKRIKGKIPEVKLLEAGNYLDGMLVSDCQISGKHKE